jgi:hypothetical protein
VVVNGGHDSLVSQSLRSLICASQMKHVRGAALAGAVSDDQRREAAARMALRLFEMLGGAGSEDDDEDGE